jgi:hypothetical protein
MTGGSLSEPEEPELTQYVGMTLLKEGGRQKKREKDWVGRKRVGSHGRCPAAHGPRLNVHCADGAVWMSGDTPGSRV